MQTLLTIVLFYLVVFSIALPLEIFVKKDKLSASERAHGLIFWPALIFMQMAVTALVAGLPRGLLIVPFGKLTSPLGIVAAFLWVDFTFYWFHRFQHRFLWPFHQVHHSIRRLSAINSYHHITEPIFHAAIVSVPLSLVGFSPVGVGALALFFRAQPYLIHSASFHLPPRLRLLLVDSVYHRVHHSLDPAHRDKNFGAMTPLWDWLFGTIYFPGPDEWPEIGLEERPEPQTYRQWLRIGPVRNRVGQIGSESVVAMARPKPSDEPEGEQFFNSSRER